MLPGIGPIGAIVLLLPATFKICPHHYHYACRIFYGAHYGGSTTSPVNIPGERSSIMTCLDGYQMARRDALALPWASLSLGSFIAGTFGVIGLMLIANPLANFALSFGPPEYFALVCMGLVILTYLAQGSMLKALMMGLVGILIGNVGLDIFTSLPRFTLGFTELEDGVGIAPLAMGLFGVSEVLLNIEQTSEREDIPDADQPLWPSIKDWTLSTWPMVRGSVLGFFLGILPGGGPVLPSFLSYAIEKKISRHREQFGKERSRVLQHRISQQRRGSGGLRPAALSGNSVQSNHGVALFRSHNPRSEARPHVHPGEP